MFLKITYRSLRHHLKYPKITHFKAKNFEALLFELSPQLEKIHRVYGLKAD